MPTKKPKIKVTATPPTVAKLRKLFKASPELAPMAPYIGGGIKAVEYVLNLLDATKTVEAPRGIELSAVEIRAKNATSKKTVGEISVANFIIAAVKKQIGYEEDTCCHGKDAGQYCNECADGLHNDGYGYKKGVPRGKTKRVS
jgi:hypothetical protein